MLRQLPASCPLLATSLRLFSSSSYPKFAVDAPVKGETASPRAVQPFGLFKRNLVFDLREFVPKNSGYLMRQPLKDFLEFLLELNGGRLEVILWTSADEHHAKETLDLIDPQGLFTVYRNPIWLPFAFESSVEQRFVCKRLKRLELLGRDLSTTLLLENNPHFCVCNRNNSLIVPDFESSNNDTTLKDLMVILTRLLHSRLPIHPFLQQLHEEKVIGFSEHVSSTFGPMGSFYHLGPIWPREGTPQSTQLRGDWWHRFPNSKRIHVPQMERVKNY